MGSIPWVFISAILVKQLTKALDGEFLTDAISVLAGLIVAAE